MTSSITLPTAAAFRAPLSPSICGGTADDVHAGIGPGEFRKPAAAILIAMRPSTAEVFEAALALPDDDRAKLVEKLVESLEGELDLDAETAWAAEIERRIARIDARQASSISMDEAIARLHRAARVR